LRPGRSRFAIGAFPLGGCRRLDDRRESAGSSDTRGQHRRTIEVRTAGEFDPARARDAGHPRRTVVNRPRATIFSGAGAYQDPWHDYAATSACLESLLRNDGFSVEVREDIDPGLTEI